MTKITLYKKMGGARNKVNKSPSQSTVLTGDLKTTVDDTDSKFSLKNPIILIRYDESILSSAFVYAKVFNKYYFIDDIIASNERLFELHLTLDVLYCYRSQINDTHIIAGYEQNYYNPYIPDKRVLTSSSQITEVKTTNLPSRPLFILGVNGENPLIDETTQYADVTNASGIAYYSLTPGMLKRLVTNLYDTTFMEGLNSLLFNKTSEGLLSLHILPYGYGHAVNQDQMSDIIIGNVNMGIRALRIGNTQRYVTDHISIPKYFYSFLDHDPYTTVTLNIAGVGNVPLDPKLVVGHSIYVTFTGRFQLGDGVASVYRDDGYLLSTHPVSMAIGIPLNIESDVSMLTGIGSVAAAPALGAVAALAGAAAAPVAGITAVAGGILSAVTPVVSNSTGGGSQAHDSWANTLTLTITRPAEVISNRNYINIGNVSGRSGQIKDFKGLVQPTTINPDRLQNPYSDEISKILLNGFIV